MNLEHLSSSLDVAIGQYSSAGVKAVNEDAIGIRIPDGPALTTKGIVAVIADGVSAAEGGQEASATAVSAFLSDYYSTHDTWSVETSGSKVLSALNRWLYGRGQHCIQAETGYITTFSAVVLKSSSAYVFHVGDSRVYRLRGGDLEQITRDHSTAVGNGQRYLARALGIDLNLEVDFHRLELAAGDRFLLTTDGVHEWLKPRELQELTAGRGGTAELDGLCRRVAERALAMGSDDNLSVQVVDVLDPGTAGQEDVLASVGRLPFPPPLQPGNVVDGWRVVAEIQASSRSEVYLVENTGDGGRAVLKAPSANFSDDPGYIERFMLEEWVGSRIASASVARVIKPAGAKSFLYYLTEYVPGPTLGQLLRERTRLPVVDAQNIAVQAISGLRAFHRRDVLHQDIKPDNIIYTERGIRIIDFGSCQVAGVGEIGNRISRQQALGTRDYCAPEYLLNGPISPRSDQFSLAVLLYELLTGRHPFGAGYGSCTTEEDFARLDYKPAYRINPLVPVWLDGAIQRALSLDPQARYPALSELAQDIQRPNPAYESGRRAPAGGAAGVLLWKAIAGALLLLNLLLLVLIGTM
ncbi:MAG: protein kinase [Porticoccaceae bacterium]